MSSEEAAGRTPQGDVGHSLPEGPEVLQLLWQARLVDKKEEFLWEPSEDLIPNESNRKNA